MSWFDTKSFASLAKTALKEAQKKIDQVLDIQEDGLDVAGGETDLAGVTMMSPGGASHTLLSGKTEPNDGSDLRQTDKEHATRTKESSSSEEMFLKDTDEQSVLITKPPSVSLLGREIDAVTSRTKAVALADVFGKREPIASTLDSVDVLSPPQITPCSDETGDISESVELLTATSDVATSDSETNLGDTATDSIVIVSSSRGFDIEEKGRIESTSDTPKEGNTGRRLSEELTYELQTIDSDSTQSFEDVQHHIDSNDITFSECTARETRRIVKGSKSETTSTNNSNDEIETATSSDIEIISNPNGDTSSTASTTTRTSPLKPEKKIDVTSGTANAYSNNISNACTRKGHCREPSEISILSLDSPSEDEVEKLLKRISELNAIVEARELSLLQSERQNAELQERNTDLQALVSTGNLQPSEEYTKRLSALEKKFQNCIRERDSLRLEVSDLQAKLPKNDLALALTESQNMVAELRHEGEKLSKDILQQSNIIKKLRSKEKATDIQVKTLKDQATSISDEVDRLKKTLSAKEDVERTQIEAVHKMSSENQRLDKDNSQLRSKLDDSQEKLNALQRNFDVVKSELQQRSKQHSDLSRSAENAQATEREKLTVQAENNELQRNINELREKLRSSDQTAAKREQKLREENRNLMDRLEAAELRAETSTQEMSLTTIPLMRHLESLQQTLNQRTSNWNKEEKCLLEKLEASQIRLRELEHIEETSKSEKEALKAHCQDLEERMNNAIMQEEKARISIQLELNEKESEHNRQLLDLNKLLEESQAKIKTLEESQSVMQQSLTNTTNKFNASVECLQRNQSSNSLVDSPQSAADASLRPHSPAVSAGINSLEDGLGGSIDWQQDDLDCISNSGRPAAMPGLGFHYMSQNTSNFEYLPSLLKQRDGELAQCQWELSRLQAERNVLQEELMQLSIELETLKEKSQSYELMEGSYSDLQTRYDALLQMYGEKVERCDEMELDLVECKEAYKIQLQELLAKLKT